MSRSAPLTIDPESPPFDRYKGLRWLAPERSGHEPNHRGRHDLFVARERHNPVNVLIKVTSKPGLVYEQDLDNEFRKQHESTVNPTAIHGGDRFQLNQQERHGYQRRY